MLISIISSNLTPRDKFIIMVAFLVSAMFAITIHEWAHGYVAKLNGDNTAQLMGRLTLNPFKHFDFFGFMMFVIVGFGWARPVPINPNNFKNYKKGVISVSLAGVFANLIMSFVNFGLMLAVASIGDAAGINSEFAYVIYSLFLYLFMYGAIINISLIAFNILPIYPLDGFNVLEMVTKPNNRLVAFLKRYGYYILIALLIIGSVIPAFDIIGMYFSSVQSAIFRLFEIIFGA